MLVSITIPLHKTDRDAPAAVASPALDGGPAFSLAEPEPRITPETTRKTAPETVSAAMADVPPDRPAIARHADPAIPGPPPTEAAPAPSPDHPALLTDAPAEAQTPRAPVGDIEATGATPPSADFPRGHQRLNERARPSTAPDGGATSARSDAAGLVQALHSGHRAATARQQPVHDVDGDSPTEPAAGPRRPSSPPAEDGAATPHRAPMTPHSAVALRNAPAGDPARAIDAPDATGQAWAREQPAVEPDGSPDPDRRNARPVESRPLPPQDRTGSDQHRPSDAGPAADRHAARTPSGDPAKPPAEHLADDPEAARSPRPQPAAAQPAARADAAQDTSALQTVTRVDAPSETEATVAKPPENATPTGTAPETATPPAPDPSPAMDAAGQAPARPHTPQAPADTAIADRPRPTRAENRPDIGRTEPTATTVIAPTATMAHRPSETVAEGDADADERDQPADPAITVPFAGAMRPGETPVTPSPEPRLPDPRLPEPPSAEPLVSEPLVSEPSLTKQPSTRTPLTGTPFTGPMTEAETPTVPPRDAPAPHATDMPARVEAAQTPAADPMPATAPAVPPTRPDDAASRLPRPDPAPLAGAAQAEGAMASSPLPSVVTAQDLPPGAPLGPAVMRQIAEAILLDTARDRLEIRLDPPELGSVEITIDIEEGGVRVTLSAERGETLELMRRNGEALQRELLAAGFGGASLDFARRGARQPQPLAADAAGGAEPAALAAAPSLRPLPGLIDGRLDMRL